MKDENAAIFCCKYECQCKYMCKSKFQHIKRGMVFFSLLLLLYLVEREGARAGGRVLQCLCV